MKMITSTTRNSINHAPYQLALLFIPLALTWLALLPQARAVCEEGCLTNQNTVLGEDALLNNENENNTAIGFNALFSNTGGDRNTALGHTALFSNMTGRQNTAVGAAALKSNTVGYYNTALGAVALFANTTGFDNTALGTFALQVNATGDNNTAVGFSALFQNTTGRFNTAIGSDALAGNSDGEHNTAIGFEVLLGNESASNNTATGYLALRSNTSGESNTADGSLALSDNMTGDNNTATGFQALASNGVGNGNTASGVFALSSNTGGDKNTAAGIDALRSNTSGSFNVALGAEAGENLTTGSNNIDIGNRGIAGESSSIRIGQRQTNTYIAGISGATVPTGVAVIVGTDGHLGTTTSSARYKEGIKPMERASETILALKPVTFRYKHELDPEGIPQFGLVAEDVEKVNPALVARDDKGKPYTVRYDAVNAMLLNEFLKEHRKVQELETGMRVLTARLNEQASQIRNISTELEARRCSPQIVVNDR